MRSWRTSVWNRLASAMLCASLGAAALHPGWCAEPQPVVPSSPDDTSEPVSSDAAAPSPSAPDTVGESVVRVNPDVVPDAGAVSLVCIARGNSSRQACDKAIAALPLDKLSPDNRKRVEYVIRTQSLFRRLPVYTFPADRRTYTYFASHPEMTVGIWRALGISRFQLRRTAPDYYEADSGDGSTGTVEVLYRDSSQHLVFCQGEYKSPLLVRPIRAAAVMYLKTKFHQDDQGRETATHQLDMFVSFPSLTVEAVAKVISPLSNLIADRNFHEVSLFVSLMSLAMSTQPGWMEQLASRLDGVPDADKEELLKVTAEVHAAARKNEGVEAGTSPVVLSGALEPQDDSCDVSAVPKPSDTIARKPSDPGAAVK